MGYEHNIRTGLHRLVNRCFINGVFESAAITTHTETASIKLVAKLFLSVCLCVCMFLLLIFMPLFIYLAFVLLCGFYSLKLYIFLAIISLFFCLFFLSVDRAALVTKTDYISAKNKEQQQQWENSRERM